MMVCRFPSNDGLIDFHPMMVLMVYPMMVDGCVSTDGLMDLHQMMV